MKTIELNYEKAKIILRAISVANGEGLLDEEDQPAIDDLCKEIENAFPQAANY